MQSNFQKISLFLSIIFFVLLSFTFFFFYKEINSNNEKAEQSLIELGNETNRRDEIKALNYSIEIIKEDRALLGAHFAQSSDIVPFLDTIESLAPMVGAKAETTSVDILKDNTGLMVQINASGSFESLYKFITLLENSPYELEFVLMDMQKEAEGGVSLRNIQESKWQAVLKVKLLSFVQ